MPELMALLRELDDPQALERPPGYRHDLTRAKLEELVVRLEGDFRGRCAVDRNVQDASLHGRVEVPAAVLKGSAQLVVSVSNFGSMAVVSAENPGVYLDLADAVADGAADAGDLRTVVRALEALGYVVVPEELLTEPYDGVSPLASRYPPEHPPDWWIRFFDYL